MSQRHIACDRLKNLQCWTRKRTRLAATSCDFHAEPLTFMSIYPSNYCKDSPRRHGGSSTVPQDNHGKRSAFS
jgi:hypothetical protein